MMKMQIAIDEQKAMANGINPQEVYDLIDNVFAGVKATKKVLDDGTLEYTNNQAEPKQAFSDMGLCWSNLSDTTSFMKSCSKWLFFREKVGNSGKYIIENVIEEMRKLK